MVDYKSTRDAATLSSVISSAYALEAVIICTQTDIDRYLNSV